MEILLEKYGYAWTLRIYAIATLVLVGPTLPLLYGRNPINPAASKSVKMAPGIFSKVAFTTISWANIFQGLVVYIPTLFFPPFATAIGLSTSQGTLILSITNVATIVGMVGLGALADKIDSQLLSSASSLGASLASFFLWGYSTNFIILLLFSIAQGLFAAGYSVLYSRFATAVAPRDSESQTWLYSVFEAQRGALIIAGGIMGGVLVGAGGEVRSGVYGVGRYESTVLVVGTSFALSALGVVGWWFRGERWRFQKPIIMVNMEEERLKREGERDLWKKIGEKPPILPELKLDYHH
jgi:MFS family permease